MLSNEKMLLVDDDEGIRKALALFFGSRNCSLRTFENASLALSAIEKEPYDIIICEQSLPDMNGFKFFEILNNRCCKAIKILITLYGNNTTINHIHKQGIDDLLTKPFSGEEVEAAMIRLIKLRPCL